MKSPFFSVLLPTKNRSEILADAIECVLQQTFADFELVISDNDDSDTATRKVVERYNDPRIRYFRTNGKLPMYQNWDFAFEQATGQHVLILEDKMRLVTNALEILHHYLKLHGEVPISFGLKFATTATLPDPALYPAARVIPSEEAIELFCRFSQAFFDMVPKGLDSCAPRSVLLDIKKNSPTGYLFSYVNPDYASGFMILSRVPQFLRIDEPLIYVPNNWMWQAKYSNGQSGYKKDQQIKRFMRELPVSIEQILSYVPVKAEWLWINSVIFDFFTKYQKPGHQPQIDWVAYHAFCVILVLVGKRVGGDMSPDIAAIKASLRQRGMGFTVRVAVNLFGRLSKLAWQMVLKRFRG